MLEYSRKVADFMERSRPVIPDGQLHFCDNDSGDGSQKVYDVGEASRSNRIRAECRWMCSISVLCRKPACKSMPYV